jgi:hypothetical protein
MDENWSEHQRQSPHMDWKSFVKILSLVLSITLIVGFWTTAFGSSTEAQAVPFSDNGAVNGQYDLRRLLFVDVDNDGYEDIVGYTTWNPRRLSLLMNKGDGTFSEETQARGLYLSYSNIHHITAFDIDNDGDFDLWVGDGENEASSNRLFINDGNGYFTNSGVYFSDSSKGSGAVDVDGDGDIDLLDMGNDEQIGGTLYINNGGSLSKTTNRFDGGRPHGYQGPVFGDYDNDGDPDMLTTANYYGHDHLYRNEGNGYFTDVTDQYDLSFQSECYGADGAAWADFDNDGDLDLLAMEGEKNGSDLRIRVWIRENVNSGQAFTQRYFDDRTEVGVDPEYSPDAAMVADFDNDGDLDFWPVGQRDIYFNQLVEGSAFVFTPISSVPIPVDKPSRTASWADPDHDGDIDLFYAQFNGASGEGDDVLRWYRNDLNPGANWLEVTLRGADGDAGGYGVRVYVFEAGHAGELAYLKGMREAHSGVMYHASISRILHFGGLNAGSVYDLVVRKPFNKGEFVISNVSPGQRLFIDVASPGPTPTFVDVPFDHTYYDEIEALYQNGYVAGCSTNPLMYCPERIMNRAESSVFVERGIHGAQYDPPDPTAVVFADVALDAWYADWIHGLWDDEYTAGCGTNPLAYCPDQEHTRAEGCVFYLRMLYGAGYVPSDPKGYFADVDPEKWYAKWVDACWEAGIAEPCGIEPELLFCPEDGLSRAVAAYMMVQAKELPLP